MKTIAKIATALLVLTTSAVNAQDEKEVFLFSKWNPTSTARSLGLGNAMSSVGADFSALYTNPAGIAKYSKNELMFTGAYKTADTKTSYENKTTLDDKSKLALDNVGIVFSNRQRRGQGWHTVNFAIGLNKIADLSNAYNYNGINTTNSIVNIYANDANAAGGLNNFGQWSFESQLAYGVYLLDTISNDPNKKIYSYVPANIKQNKSVVEKGSVQELNLALGNNNNDNILFGASIGFPLVNYQRQTIYSESDNSGKTNNDFDYQTITENIKTTGAGINLKLGAIYIPNRFVRIGAAIHTPTYYNLTEEGETSIESNLEAFSNNKPLVKTGLRSAFDYTIQTPLRAMLGASFFVGKYGFISADLERVNYSKGRFDFESSTNSSNAAGDELYKKSVNNVVKQTGVSATNFKLGAELRGKAISARAGLILNGSQTNSSIYNNGNTTYCLGAGFRGNSFFADVAWATMISKDRNNLYVLNGYTMPTASIANRNQSISVTMGWKF
jgi:hypothetical protein